MSTAQNKEQKSKGVKLNMDHHIVLAHFIKATLRETVKNETYSGVILKDVRELIDSLEKDNFLRKATKSEILEKIFDKGKLETLCKKYGQKVSGKKVDLIERLITSSEIPEFEIPIINKHFYIMSDSGREYLDELCEARDLLEQLCIQDVHRLFLNGDVDTALKACNKCFKAIRDSCSSDLIKFSIPTVQCILKAKPESLPFLNEEQLNNLRVALVMSVIWRQKKPDGWINHNLFEDVDTEMCCHHIRCNANINEKIDQITWSDKFKISFSDYDIDSCEICKSKNGKVIEKESIRNYPHFGCKSDTGCNFILNEVYNFNAVNDDLKIATDDLNDCSDLDNDPVVNSLRKLKMMLDEDLISADEYQNKKLELLSKV
jgi:hypothetical protein